jgi:hypothetical protein
VNTTEAEELTGRPFDDWKGDTGRGHFAERQGAADGCS